MPVDALQNFALAMGLSWASGLRLYAAVTVVGLAARFHAIELPSSLAVLTDPWVIGVAGFMWVVEFVADKVPWVDSTWDAIQTFVRIPAGIVLAASAVGDVSLQWQVIAALLGGLIVSGTHFTKLGARAMINASPEPFSNWAASFSEEAVVLGGLWLLFAHPFAFLILLAGFVVSMIWLLPRLLRWVGAAFGRFAQLFKSAA